MNNKRRDFLKSATALGSGLALAALSNKLMGCTSGPTNAEKETKDFGLQLYTLRTDMPKDPKGVLKQVASFGYKQIEGFEGPMGLYWGMSNKEFKKYLDDLGMKMISSHCDINKDFERKADEAAAIGLNYLLCPYFGPHPHIDDFKKEAELFNKLGAVCKKAGLRFGYHNHDYSFKPVDGQLPQDVLMQQTDPSLVDFEMDIYWVVTAGQDPIAWFNKYPDRFKLCHIKDRKNVPSTERDASVVLGKGTINFPDILKAGEKKGLKYFIVEQERYDDITPINAVKEDAAYMKKLKV